MAKVTRRFATASSADAYLRKARSSGKTALVRRDATRGSKKPYIVITWSKK